MKKGLRPNIHFSSAASANKLVRIDALMKKGLRLRLDADPVPEGGPKVRIDALMKKGLRLFKGIRCVEPDLISPN